MKTSDVFRYAATSLPLVSLAILAFGAIGEANSQSQTIENGVASYVAYGFGNALAHGETVCPDGRSLGYRQIFEQGPDGPRREGESATDHTRRLVAGERQAAVLEGGQNACGSPELAPPDQHYRQMTATDVVSYGIDLDGQTARRNGRAAPGTCAHDDFMGVNGARGVDNQMLRVVGCDGSGQAYASEDTGDLPRGDNGVSEGMLQGGWGILVSLRGVDNVRNDDSVEVGIYANADPIQLSPARTPIPNATYAADQDPRFRAETHGRIVNGVLTTDPTDVRFHWLVAGIHLERPLRHARLRVTINADGGFEGYLSGYTPVEAMYNINYGFRDGVTDAGEPAPVAMREILSVGGNTVMGRTCQGAYQALHALADGDRDPETGRCSSISTQYWIRAIPAFVVDAETRSVNE